MFLLIFILIIIIPLLNFFNNKTSLLFNYSISSKVFIEDSLTRTFYEAVGRKDFAAILFALTTVFIT